MGFNRYKFLKKGLILLNSCLLFWSCTGTPNLGDLQNQDNIGEQLGSVAEPTSLLGQQNSLLSIFDPTIRKIHLFNLKDFSFIRTLNVENPSSEHMVVNSESGAYILDFYQRNVNVYSTKSNSPENLVSLIGKPISVSFRPEVNLLIIKDDLDNVEIVKLDNNGKALSAPVRLGPIVNQESTDILRAGDLLADGRLVMSTQSGKILIVDIEQTIAQNKWIHIEINPHLTDVTWIAPIRNQNELIFVKAKGSLNIINLNSGNVVSQVPIDSTDFIKFSKRTDPHVLVKSALQQNMLRVYYPLGTEIKYRDLFKQGSSIITSYLNLQNDTWSFVETSSLEFTNGFYTSLENSTKKSRRFKKYRLSDLKSLQVLNVLDKAQIKISEEFIFSLTPSELGFATRTTIDTGEVKELKLFNLPFIK